MFYFTNHHKFIIKAKYLASTDGNFYNTSDFKKKYFILIFSMKAHVKEVRNNLIRQL